VIDAKREGQTLSDMDVGTLQSWLGELGQPKFRALQIQEWLWTHLAVSLEEMTNLPKSLRLLLSEQVETGALCVVQEQVSVDGTAKWAFEGHGTGRFETVMIPDEDRRTACISSQVGCAMGCAFCRTAQMGFVRNLSRGEILQQVAHVQRWLRDRKEPALTNIVFMGMGEPLNNLPQVLSACATLTDPKGFGMSPRRITISTSGLVERIRELSETAPQYHLAISLNSSNDTTRDQVMPVNRRHPLSELLQAGDAWSRAADWSVTYEYVLIGDVTCTAQAAHETVALLGNRRCKLNLIPLNASEDIPLRAPTELEIQEFEGIVREGGLQVFRRKPKGRDILAACGQLARKAEQKIAALDEIGV
jgi:23S rRNA (adenine2503-C2)-methyltransferase